MCVALGSHHSLLRTRASYLWFASTQTPVALESASVACSMEQVILEVAGELDEQAVPDDITKWFDEEAAVAAVNVLHIPEEHLRQRTNEAALRTRREARAHADEYENRELDLVWRELSVRRRLKAMESRILATGKAAAMIHEKRAMDKERVARRYAAQIISRTRSFLASALNLRTEPSPHFYTHRDMQDLQFAPRFRALQIRVDCLRAVRSKVRAGKYSVMVRIFDQIGGLPLEGIAAVSKPVSYDGAHGTERMDFGEVLNIQLPERPVRSTEVLVVEILDVSDASSTHVVGWTILPACGADLQWVQGCFRLPVHRGATNYSISRHWDFELAYTKDLECWLANAYIQVRRIHQEQVHTPQNTSEMEQSRVQELSPEMKDSETRQLNVDMPSDQSFSWRLAKTDVHLEAFYMSFRGLASSQLGTKTGDVGLWRRKVVMLRDEFRLAWQTMAVGNYRQIYAWCTGLLALWVALYIHFFTQLAYLMANRVPVTRMKMGPFHVQLQYPQAGVSSQTEVGLVGAGPLGVCGVFGLACVGLSCIQRWSPHLLASFDTFMLTFGLAAIADPLLILLVDSLVAPSCGSDVHCGVEPTAEGCTCAPGDWLKLAFRMNAEGSTWFVGALYTVSLYSGSMMLGVVEFYWYFTVLFRNGRVLDTYRRLFSAESAFFVPHDHEISGREFHQVCRVSEMFIGPHGERRVVVACDYDFMDPSKTDGKSHLETDTAVSIYEINRWGSRRLWRQFYRTHNGCVLEVDIQTRHDLEAESREISRALGLEHPVQNLHRGGEEDDTLQRSPESEETV